MHAVERCQHITATGLVYSDPIISVNLLIRMYKNVSTYTSKILRTGSNELRIRNNFTLLWPFKVIERWHGSIIYDKLKRYTRDTYLVWISNIKILEIHTNYVSLVYRFQNKIKTKTRLNNLGSVWTPKIPTKYGLNYILLSKSELLYIHLYSP